MLYIYLLYFIIIKFLVYLFITNYTYSYYLIFSTNVGIINFLSLFVNIPIPFSYSNYTSILYSNNTYNIFLLNILVLFHPFCLYIYILSYKLYCMNIVYLNFNKLIFICNYNGIYLFISIVLGSIWSSQELLWGGYWNWDVIEISQMYIILYVMLQLHSKLKFYYYIYFIKCILHLLIFFIILNKSNLFITQHSFSTSFLFSLNLIYFFTFLILFIYNIIFFYLFSQSFIIYNFLFIKYIILLLYIFILLYVNNSILFFDSSIKNFYLFMVNYIFFNSNFNINILLLNYINYKIYLYFFFIKYFQKKLNLLLIKHYLYIIIFLFIIVFVYSYTYEFNTLAINTIFLYNITVTFLIKFSNQYIFSQLYANFIKYFNIFYTNTYVYMVSTLINKNTLYVYINNIGIYNFTIIIFILLYCI